MLEEFLAAARESGRGVLKMFTDWDVFKRKRSEAQEKKSIETKSPERQSTPNKSVSAGSSTNTKSSKEPTNELTWQANPVPGLYRMNEDKTGLLIAICPITGRRDSEHVFQVSPNGDCNASSSARHLSIFGESRQSPSAEELTAYKYICEPIKVEYCKILDRYEFSAELERRYITWNIIEGQVRYMFRLDNPYYFVSIGDAKIGEQVEVSRIPKIAQNRKGIDEDLWYCAPGDLTDFRKVNAEEAQRARDEMAKKGCEPCCKTGSEPYMKVQRYLQVDITSSPACLSN